MSTMVGESVPNEDRNDSVIVKSLSNDKKCTTNSLNDMDVMLRTNDTQEIVKNHSNDHTTTISDTVSTNPFNNNKNNNNNENDMKTRHEHDNSDTKSDLHKQPAPKDKETQEPDDEVEENEVQYQQQNQLLRDEVDMLTERCRRLEAQNILVSVQQLDILTRVITFTIWCITVYIYFSCLLRFVFPLLPIMVRMFLQLITNNSFHGGTSKCCNGSTSNITRAGTGVDHIHSSQPMSTKILSSSLATVQGNGSVIQFVLDNVPFWNKSKNTPIDSAVISEEEGLAEEDFSYLSFMISQWQSGDESLVSMVWRGLSTSTSMQIITVILPILVICIKVLFISLPFVHHRIYHGLFYRRIEVFVIFFVMFARMKLCRWREKMFATQTTEHLEDVNVNMTFTNAKNEKTKLKSYGEDITEDGIWDANYEISARFLYVSIIRLKGLWTKTAQYLSSRADFMPPSYVRELKRLQDEAPESLWEDVVHTIPKRILDAVTDIDTKPLASASIGQVHTARLRATGEKIVIKIQHPSARTLLMDDFRSLSIICKITSFFEPDYKFIEILMREWSNEATKELDFLLEVQNLLDAQIAIDTMENLPINKSDDPSDHIMNGIQHRSPTMLDGVKIPKKVLYTSQSRNIDTESPTAPTTRSVPFQVEIPRPMVDLSTKSILIMSYCEGTRIDDFDTIDHVWHIPREAVVTAVAQTFAHMMYCTNIFNGDPHVGNLKIRKGITTFTKNIDSKSNNCTTEPATDDSGFTIVLLDWGLTKRLGTNQRLAFCQMAYAAATFDYGLLLDSFSSIGLRLKRENVAEDMEGIRFILREMAPHSTSRKRIKAKMKTDMNRMNERPKNEKIPVDSKSYPGEFFFFVRVNELLQGLGSKLHVTLNYLDVLKPYTEHGISQFAMYNGEIDNKKGSPLVGGMITTNSDTILESKVRSFIQLLIAQNKIAGVQVAVLHANGNQLVNVFDGNFGGLKRNIPMRPDALILGYSCTKAIAATLAHLMVQEGFLSYDEPVCSRVWPAFCPTEEPPAALRLSSVLSTDDLQRRWGWKRQITLRHILTHTAGLSMALPARMTVKSLASCEQCAAAFEYNELFPEEILLPTSCPGSNTMYHAMSFGWLVAGVVVGAYKAKCRRNDEVTFHDVYSELLVPKLSTGTLQSGFRPFGGTDNFPEAYTVTDDITASTIAQKAREAKARGEHKDGGNATVELPAVLESYRGKEFLLDPRIWNCTESLKANVPACGGRFSATGLAKFYHDLGSGCILNHDVLDTVTDVIQNNYTTDESSKLLQGETNMSNSTTNNNNNNNSSENGIQMGFGYQLITTDKDMAGSTTSTKNKPSAFGHAGVGGSIGFHHIPSKISVAVMLNKADGDKTIAKAIVLTIANHFDW